MMRGSRSLRTTVSFLMGARPAMNLKDLAQHYRIDKPRKFRLADFDPADSAGLSIDKAEAKVMLEDGIKRLTELQERLYAENRWSVLMIFQAMDAAGKDSAIKHVMSGVNPQGCQVFSFKAPSTQELDHDYMWRTTKCLPERGRIGIFNRSYYEEVLVVRAHPEILAAQHLPPGLVTKDIWQQRYEHILNFEHYLERNGTVVLKFFLHVSKEEQRKRFLARLDEPGKRWKFSMNDVKERKLWDDYMRYYEEMIQCTSDKRVPWFVVPADNKWFTRIVVASALVDALEGLNLQFPEVAPNALAELDQARATLEAEAPAGATKNGNGKNNKDSKSQKVGNDSDTGKENNKKKNKDKKNK
jgi:PPK2 family polyphosphate:nucleotide phosphotransferase